MTFSVVILGAAAIVGVLRIAIDDFDGGRKVLGVADLIGAVIFAAIAVDLIVRVNA